MIKLVKQELPFSKNDLIQTIEMTHDFIKFKILNEKLPRRIRECPKTIQKLFLPFRAADIKV